MRTLSESGRSRPVYTASMQQEERSTGSTLGLAFAEPGLEQAFREHYDRTYRFFVKLGIGVGTLMFASFGPLDRLLFPNAWEQLWWWRYAFCLPPLLLTFLLLFLVRDHRWVQPVVTLVAVLVGMGTLGMLNDAPPKGYSFFYAGLMLIIFYIHAFVRLRFAWATLASLVIFAGHEYLVWWLRPVFSTADLLAGHAFLLAAVVGGMGTSYSLEKDARSQFLLQRHLDRERKRLETANRELEKLNEKLERLARVDELTGIANRRSFMEQLTRAWRAELRKGREAAPLSLLLVDIDHFKDYNDLYGHPEGDRCLKQVAGILASFARRPRDLAARIGGEEFVLLLPETGLDQALELAQALRTAVMEAGIPHAASSVAPQVTVSVGVASQVPLDARNPESLLQQADQALYRAKREGRNRVVKAD